MGTHRASSPFQNELKIITCRHKMLFTNAVIIHFGNQVKFFGPCPFGPEKEFYMFRTVCDIAVVFNFQHSKKSEHLCYLICLVTVGRNKPIPLVALKHVTQNLIIPICTHEIRV